MKMRLISHQRVDIRGNPRGPLVTLRKAAPLRGRSEPDELWRGTKAMVRVCLGTAVIVALVMLGVVLGYV